LGLIKKEEERRQNPISVMGHKDITELVLTLKKDNKIKIQKK
jgi:hypothetical protein